MYKLEYLPSARQDMMDIVRYIAVELKNPTAAENLAAELIEAGEGICDFPYSNPAYLPIRPLKHEYRKLQVRNYLMLYWIDEEPKRITVARVIYAKRDIQKIME